jgi:hypothetical protein
MGFSLNESFYFAHKFECEIIAGSEIKIFENFNIVNLIMQRNV